MSDLSDINTNCQHLIVNVLIHENLTPAAIHFFFILCLSPLALILVKVSLIFLTSGSAFFISSIMTNFIKLSLFFR